MIRRLFLTGLLATAGAAVAKPAASLCTRGEVPVFACAIGTKVAAVCGHGTTATYRFGKPDRVELEATGLALAERSYAGGGETQIAFDRGAFRYVLYDSTIRTSFAADGRHDPAMTSGLLVLRSGAIVSRRACRGVDGIAGTASRYMPAGDFIEHR